MNISYEEFKERLLEDARNIVRQELGPDVEVTIGTATEGEPEEVMCITKEIPEVNGDAKGYVSEFPLKFGYEKYLRRPVWAELLRSLRNHLKRIAAMPEEFDLGFLKTFKTAKEYLGIVPLSMKDRGMAEDEICVMMDDIPMSVIVVLPESADGINIGRIPKKILEYWGVSKEEVLGAAVLNQMQKHKPVIKPMQKLLKSISPLHALLFLVGAEQEEEEDMWVATTEDSQLGSVCMVYPGFLDKACAELGEDVFVFPSSIDEVILMKQSEAKEFVLRNPDFVNEVNKGKLRPNEVLSDKVYHYERATQTFESAKAWYQRVHGLDL